MAITTRTQQDTDIPNIVNLYNRIVDNGGYALANSEFDRRITQNDWRDFQEYYGHAVRLVFEDDGRFFGFCAMAEEKPTEISFLHLGVFQVPVPEEIMWQIVEWLQANTKYETLIMETQDLTNRDHFNSLADTLEADTDGTVRRKKLADATRPPVTPTPRPRPVRPVRRTTAQEEGSAGPAQKAGRKRRNRNA